MARSKGSFSLAGAIEPLAAAPLDARSTVRLKADLTGENAFPYPYEGMTVYVAEEKKKYTLIDASDTTDLDNWQEEGAGSGSGSIDAVIYQPKGSVLFENLPVPAASKVGWVYNIEDDFITTADFVEGANKNYGAGSNVVIIEADTDTYKYDVLGGAGSIDTSDLQGKMQYAELPTASSELEGKIFQYTGATENGLVNGYYYQCIEDPDNAGEYIYIAKATQEGGSGALENALTATKTVGGITTGTSFPIGTGFEQILKNLLNPVEYPTFTAPSASISATGSKLLETGATLSTTITATLNRGTIAPAYGTTGYRSGDAIDYALNGGTAQASNTFTETVSASNKTFKVAISYAAGEQPKNSIGEDYSTPLDAGSVESNTITFDFVNALWSNAANIGTIAKEALVAKSAKEKIFTFPAATVANPEVFDVPASWTVTAVQVLNTLSNQYEDCAGEFTVTDTAHDDAAGVSTAYKRYTNNLGYAMDSRKIKIKWS